MGGGSASDSDLLVSVNLTRTTEDVLRVGGQVRCRLERQGCQMETGNAQNPESIILGHGKCIGAIWWCWRFRR